MRTQAKYIAFFVLFLGCSVAGAADFAQGLRIRGAKAAGLGRENNDARAD